MSDSLSFLPTPVCITEQHWPEGTVPLVSIHCLTYNHANFIRDAIEGFLIQETTFPVEILIHDDASSDGTAEIVRGYEVLYPRLFRVVYQVTNQYSQGKNLSGFMEECIRGKYVAICEGDDYWVDKRKLQIQADFLEKNPEVVITYADSLAFNENGVLHVDFGGARRDLTAGELLRSPAIFTLTAMYRNIIKIPPEFSVVSYGDLGTWSLLGEHGSGKYLDSIKPSMYRVHVGGIHSQATVYRRRIMSLRTFSAQMTYFLRVGKVEIADYYRSKMLLELMALEGVNGRLLPVTKGASSVLRGFLWVVRRFKNWFHCKARSERA